MRARGSFVMVAPTPAQILKQQETLQQVMDASSYLRALRVVFQTFPAQDNRLDHSRFFMPDFDPLARILPSAAPSLVDTFSLEVYGSRSVNTARIELGLDNVLQINLPQQGDRIELKRGGKKNWQKAEDLLQRWVSELDRRAGLSIGARIAEKMQANPA